MNLFDLNKVAEAMVAPGLNAAKLPAADATKIYQSLHRPDQVAPVAARIGMTATKLFSGLAPKGWKVVSDDATEAANAAKAIDGDPATNYQIDNTTLPHSLTMDMGREVKIAGFSYLPRQDRNASGVVDTYRFETSTDGKTLLWSTFYSGSFGAGVNGVAAEPLGDVWIAGSSSVDLPITANAYSPNAYYGMAFLARISDATAACSTPDACRNAAVPTTTSRPSTRPRTPRPA